MRRSLWQLLLIAAVATFAALPARAAVHVTVNETQVSVDGIAPYGKVVLFNLSFKQNEQGRIGNYMAALQDTDGDGVVTYNPPAGIPLRSIWVAVDQTSGGSTSGGRQDYPVRRSPPQLPALRVRGESQVTSYTVAADTLYVIVVRPQVGAWKLIAHDGSFGDADGIGNGTISIDFSALRPIEGTLAPPQFLTGGDVLATVDPAHMELELETVPAGSGGGQ